MSPNSKPTLTARRIRSPRGTCRSPSLKGCWNKRPLRNRLQNRKGNLLRICSHPLQKMLKPRNQLEMKPPSRAISLRMYSKPQYMKGPPMPATRRARVEPKKEKPPVKSPAANKEKDLKGPRMDKMVRGAV